jgi:lipopolysaccharide export system protein LptA
MRRRPDLVAIAVLATLCGAAQAEPGREAPAAPLFDTQALAGRKEPIVVTSDTLEYDYKTNVVVYRGDVQAAQGPVKVRSDTLTVTLVSSNGSPTGGVGADPGAGAGSGKLQHIVAAGNVRIDNGTRWATGGRAVFDQSERTFVLTESPVMHDGSNEVAGERVTVYLDENRSVVVGGRRRVKAVLYPNKDGGLAPAEGRGAAKDGKNEGGSTARNDTPPVDAAER